MEKKQNNDDERSKAYKELYNKRVSGELKLANAAEALYGPNDLSELARLIVSAFPDFTESIQQALPTIAGWPERLATLEEVIEAEGLNEESHQLPKKLRDMVIAILQQQSNYHAPGVGKVTSFVHC